MKPRKTRTRKKLEPIVAPSETPPVVTPQVPPIALTLKQWGGNALLQRELQTHLDSPVMKMAFQTILMAAMPNASPVEQLIPDVSAEQMALADSMRYRHRSGMTHVYRALHNLARAKNQPPKQAPWGELLVEDE